MNPLNNPLYKPAPKPYIDGQYYWILIQDDYGPHDRPPQTHWEKAKYLTDSQGDNHFVSPFLPQRGTYQIKDVVIKDVSEDTLIFCSYGLFEQRNGFVSIDGYKESILKNIYIDEDHRRAKGFHQGFLRGLEFAEKFL